jgi:hypothetical protein
LETFLLLVFYQFLKARLDVALQAERQSEVVTYLQRLGLTQIII